MPEVMKYSEYMIDCSTSRVQSSAWFTLLMQRRMSGRMLKATEVIDWHDFVLCSARVEQCFC